MRLCATVSRLGALGAAAVLIVAACGGSPSQSPSSGASGPAAPSSLPVSGVGNDLAGLPSSLDSVAVLAGLLDTPVQDLDPTLTAIRDQLLAELGDSVKGPVKLPPAFSSVDARLAAYSAGGTDEAGFAVLMMLILGTVMPSQPGAESVAEIAGQVGGESGRDVPDGPKEDSTSTNVPLTGSSAGEQMAGSYAMDVHASQTRSQVTVDLTRHLQMQRTAAGTTATLDMTVTTTVTVDFCPDAGGQVPVHLVTNVSLTAGPDAKQATIEAVLTGQVDDTGALAAVTGTTTIQGNTTSNGNRSNSYDLTVGNLSFPVANGTVGEATGQYSGQSDSDALAAAKVDFAKIDLDNAIPKLMSALEQIWQGNACVIVEVPDYQFMAQPGSSNDPRKEVDPASKSTFQVVVHQRFEHRDLTVPVQQLLSSEQSVDPQQVSPTPGSASYTAPNKRDVSNTDDLRAWSRRGRSDLKVDFHTRNPPLKMGLAGTFTEQAALVTLTGKVTVPATEFTEFSAGDHIDYEATVHVAVSVSMKVQGVTLPCGSVFETETGTAHLTAHAQAIDDTHQVWVIHPDPASMHFTSSTKCQITVGDFLQAGAGFGAKFFAALHDFQVPTEPGSTTVSGTNAGAGITDTASAKVTVYAVPAQP